MSPSFYSQFGEDRAIYPLFKDKGFYVDIGAYDGVLESNTYLFELMGWKGVCVEPVQSLYNQLLVNRPNSVCFYYAVWDESQPTCNFNVLEKAGWSHMEGLSHPKQYSPLLKIEHPRTRRLNQILEAGYVPQRFELLSIDVEGSESQVLKGFDLEKYIPRIVIIESWDKKGFDDFFEGYIPIYSWEQGVRGTNVIYCREPEDAEVVARRWHL